MPVPTQPQAPEETVAVQGSGTIRVERDSTSPARNNHQRDSQHPGTPTVLRPEDVHEGGQRKFGRSDEQRDPNAPMGAPARPSNKIGAVKDAAEGVVHEHVANTENDARAVEVMNNESKGAGASNGAAPGVKPVPADKRV